MDFFLDGLFNGREPRGHRMTRTINISALAVVSLLAGVASAQPKPVKVFVLAGQSNMEGHGVIAADPKRNEGKGSLEYLVKNAQTTARFKHLVDADGKWRV